MHIFRFLQKYLIRFKLRLWLGHCLTGRVIALLEVKTSLRLWMLWTEFSLRLSLYFGALSLCSTLASPSVPAAEKQPHGMRLLPPHFTFGMVLCRWWAELGSFKHDVWNWGSSNKRISFLTVWGPFWCFFAYSKCVFMCLHGGKDCIWPHQHKAQIGGVLQWCLSFCRLLLFLHMIIEFNKSDHQVLGHHSNQSPSPSIVQFCLEASSRKSPGCSKLLPFRVTETTWFCDASMQHNFFLNSSPDVWFDAILSLSSTCSLFDLRAWFLLWYAFLAARPFIKTCVPVQIIPIQLNLPQDNFTRSAVTSASNMNELNFNCPRLGYDYLCNGII